MIRFNLRDSVTLSTSSTASYHHELYDIVIDSKKVNEPAMKLGQNQAF